MPSWLEGRPFAITFIILFGIVLLRAQATYWAGRAAARGAERTRLGTRLSGPRVTRAITALHRWGLPVITISFITVGFQTVVNAAAGLTKMRWGRYTAAMVPGCAVWAALYATIGFAALTAWFELHGFWKWSALVVLAAIVAGGFAIARHVRRVTNRPTVTTAEPVAIGR